MNEGLSVLNRIARAVADGQITGDRPYVVEGDEISTTLSSLTSDFATRLRDLGFVLTLHRDAPVVPGYIELDGVNDEAGVFLGRPNQQELLVEPELPLPQEIIKYIQVRVATTCLGAPDRSGYDLFVPLEACGNLGFGNLQEGMICPDNMVIATCKKGEWTGVMVVPYSRLSFSPNMQVLHYGSADFEGMTAEWAEDGTCNIFGIKAHLERMNKCNIRVGLAPVPWDLFYKGVISAVQQNARMIPRVGRLYLRPHCADIGRQMRVGSSGTTGFFVEVTPIGSVGAYFGAQEAREDDANVPMKIMGVPDNKVRAAVGQGDVKAVGGYAQTVPVIKAVRELEIKMDGVEGVIHPDGVLFLDKFSDEEVCDDTRVCETNASNTLFFEDLGDGRYKLVVPSLAKGDILHGNTRALVIEKALEMGWEVIERDVYYSEIMDGCFCAAANCGTAVMISSFDAIHKLHIIEDKDGIKAELRGDLIAIRSQEEVNASPTPLPIAILLQKLIDVKSGKSGSEDREKYLTLVPGVRLRVGA